MAEADEKQTGAAATSTANSPVPAGKTPEANKPADLHAEKTREASTPDLKALALTQDKATAASVEAAAPAAMASAVPPKRRGRPAKLRSQPETPSVKPMRPVAKPALSKPAVVAKPTSTVKASPKRSYAPRSVAGKARDVTKDTLQKVPPLKMLKDFTMETMAPEMTANVQGAFKDMSTKAKAAYEKSTAMVGDYSEFAKGNVEAVVESSKILATGVQEMGRDYVAEARSALEAITADVKDLAAVKTPSEFFQLQTELLKKSFDAAVGFTSKNSEMMLKLTNEALAPLSNRVSVAMEKAKLAA